MMTFRNTFYWMAAICLALSLTIPAIVLADDDDDEDTGHCGSRSITVTE